MASTTYRLLVMPGIDDELRRFCSLGQGFRELDYLRHLYPLSRVLFYRAHYPDMYWEDGVSINRDQLAEVLRVNNGEATRILKHLLAWQMLDKVRGFWQGSHSRGFRLNERLEHLPVSYRSIPGSAALFIEELVKSERKRLRKPLLKHQYDLLCKRVRVNAEGLRHLRDKYRSPYLDNLLNAYEAGQRISEGFSDLFSHIQLEGSDIGLLGIVIGEIYAERPDPLSRLYTNLSNLKRTHRKYLLMDGRPLLMTDLVNSQVVFSVAAVERHLKMKAGGKAFHLPADVVRYRELALSGQFYEQLASAAGYELTAENRGAFKKAFYREVFFSRIRSRGGLVRKAFRRMFPTVAQVINQIKKGNHADFAIRLQRMEAAIMIDTVLKTMVQKGRQVLSIHDSIVVASRVDLEETEGLIVAAMQREYGFVPRFKREVEG